MDYSEILTFFNGCKKILDVGCGSGRFVELDERIVGIDNNITTKHKRIIKGDVIKIPFPSKHFDGVLSYQVIEHLDIKESYKMLKEIYRVLKKDGIFVLNSPCVFDGFWNTFSHVKPYPPPSIKSLIQGQESIPVENFSMLNFEIGDVIYDMRGFPGIGILRLKPLARFLSKNLNFRRYDYTMILKKR